MYASGNKLKNSAIKPTNTAMASSSPNATKGSAANRTNSSKTAMRSTRPSHSNLAATLGGGGSVSFTSPTQRSKYTERKSLNAVPLRTRGLRPENGTSSAMTAGSHGAGGERRTLAANALSTTRPPRIWNRYTPKEIGPNNTTSSSGQKQHQLHHKMHETKKVVIDQEAKGLEKPDPQKFISMAIQTNEPEILNRDLLIGDIKFLLPSKSLIDDIDRSREAVKKKVLLKAQRKFEEHAEKQEEHLTDLKEFLEKAVVTKRTRKLPRVSLELDRKLINQMDEILSKEVPRTESITDIKSRIKKKEEELLQLFENVENLQMLSLNNKQ